MNDTNESGSSATIMAVDDDPSILRVMKLRLGSHSYRVVSAATGARALELARENPIALAVIDYKLCDDIDGISLMEQLRKIRPDLPVIILTAYGTIGKAVDAMKRGACNYLTKPFDGEALLLQIESCLNKESFDRDEDLHADRRERPGVFSRVIARSSAMKTVLEKVAQVARTDSNVYIEGESGTGKELIALCLHAASTRKDGPFIAVNCAAIPENLMESELLGYEKGAFTGADRRRQGLFAHAHGGSFFFDEISEMPLSMQAKLLRILEEREFFPLGSNRKVKVDTRIIAASNSNLEHLIEEGLFREDLYYRIHVIPIKIPPLRERKEDILPLAKHFLEQHSAEIGKAVREIAPAAAQKLLESAWRGNVRELQNVMEYAVAMATDDVITADLIAGPIPGKCETRSLRDAKEKFERDYLVRLLELHQGNVSQAAKAAGKYRADFYVLLRKHGLDPADFRK